MKTKLSFPGKISQLFFASLLFFFSLQTFAQYTPLSVTGFNADAVCNSTSTESCTGTSTLDEQWYFYSAEKKAQGALPQTITSQMGVQYNLASFDGNNVLTIGSNGVTSGILTLDTPVQADEIWLLGISAGGKRDIEIAVQYTDNSTSDNFNYSFSDWHESNGAKTAFHGLGRLKGTNTFENKYEFGLFERVLPVNPEKTVKSISFKYNGSERTYTSIFAVAAYNNDGSRTADKELYMIANAHFDTQWDWDVQTSIDQYVKNTLEGNFNLFEKFPNYKFNFEGAIKYMFAKEYYPELYEKLKDYVASGRWHISGGSVDANDVMVPSAESIIRNFLLGQEFYKKEFGTKGGNDIMLPDCFGFPYSLPTLGKHCGIVGFHSQKLSWGSAYSYDEMPHYGIWQGVDGSQILAVHKPGAYVNQYRENMAYNGDVLNEIFANEKELGAYKTVRYFGTGDRGGSVDESTADWLEKSLASNGPVKVNVVTPDEFFESITPEEKALLPVWNNELPMREHGVGCYSSQTILKYWNRKGELLADATEKSSVLADWLGGLPYQSDIIRETWIRLLWHQFHDDLPGTSIPKAYVFTYNDLALAQLDFARTMNNAVGAVSRKMDTQTSGTPIVVYNPLSIQREDIVEATIQVESQPSNISVYDPAGKAVPAQITDYQDGVLSFIFKADIPSLGYATYELRLNDDASSKLATSLKVTNNSIENDEYVVMVNKLGDVMSIKDKKQGNKELLKSPIRLSMQEDKPGYWWSWEISWGDNERAPYGYVDGGVEVAIAEEGPLRSALKISRSKNKSQFVQYIRLTSGVNEDRIDFINEVDWQSKETLLKVVFPLNVNNPKATYDLSIGTIERGNRTSNMHEVAGHQWADMTHNDDSYGVSILNNCKYGWDKVDNNTLRLTLIHTPRTSGDREYQKYQDLGLNQFIYSFYRHSGKWNESTQWEASKLNQPLLAYEAPKHAGELGKSFEFVKTNTEKVSVKALKKAEASDDMIVRVYELVGEDNSNVEITFPANVVSAKEVNGLEEEVGTVAFSGSKISFPIGKYQPKSFAVKLAAYSGTSLSEPLSAQVDLAYNIDVMSPDSKKRDGRFGNADFVYPAELLSDAIIADGIKFNVGPRENGEKNAVQCKGQEINLPQKSSNKKLYILAASQNEAGSTVNFLVDGKEHSVKVEYFAGFAGTWGTVFAPQHYRKENIAFTATHRHNYVQNKNDSYSYLYIYKYMIPVDASAKTLTLPDDSDVIVFAVSVSDNENDDARPVTETYLLPEYKDIVPAGEPEACGIKLMPGKIAASASAASNEGPEMAADSDPFTKWCDDKSSVKTLQYGFDEPVEICQWNVLHAGLEGDSKITVDFKLQAYDQETRAWYDVDEVKGNTDNKTIRFIEPITTDRVRLYITKPEQSGNIARIYSFEIYGPDDNTGLDIAEADKKIAVENYPNPFSESTTINFYAPEYTDNIRLEIRDMAGVLLVAEDHPATIGRNQIIWRNSLNLTGVYFYTVSAMNSGKVLQQGTGKMIIR